MTTVPDKNDPGGPAVAVCAGARCAAMWRLREGAPASTDAFETAAVQALRADIRATPGGLLIRSGCVGACALGPVIGVAHRAASARGTGRPAWVERADRPEAFAGLRDWLARDWTGGAADPPAAVVAAVVPEASALDPAAAGRRNR